MTLMDHRRDMAGSGQSPAGEGMLVAVTGAGGFLGGHIASKLLERGDRVRSIGRRRYPALEAKGVPCMVADIADPGAVDAALNGTDAVIHTASLTGIWGAPKVFRTVNVEGTKNVIAACRHHGISRIVYTSTPSVVYGNQAIEGGDESLPYPARHLAVYAQTKAEAEKLILAANADALSTCAIRPHLIFGPGDRQLMPRIVDRAAAGRLRRVGAGVNRISVSYVENVADAHLAALDRLGPGGSASGQAYFINEPEPVNCWDFINRILAGHGLPKVDKNISFGSAYAAGWLFERIYRFAHWWNDPPMTRFLAAQLATSHWFRIDKAGRDLAWKPRVSLDEGIRRYLANLP